MVLLVPQAHRVVLELLDQQVLMALLALLVLME
jgi:hypothetical protein